MLFLNRVCPTVASPSLVSFYVCPLIGGQAYGEETFGAILTSSFKKTGNYTITVTLNNPLDKPQAMETEGILAGECQGLLMRILSILCSMHNCTRLPTTTSTTMKIDNRRTKTESLALLYKPFLFSYLLSHFFS
jgi:hypothetical protein